MIACVTNDNSLRERLLRESELPRSKAIFAAHAAKETRKHAREIFKSNETIDLQKVSKHSKSRSETSAQRTEVTKKFNFCKKFYYRGQYPGYRKVCRKCNRKNTWRTV